MTAVAMTVRLYILFLTFFAPLLIGVTNGQFVGENCRLNGNGGSGVCKAIRNCVAVQEGLKKGRIPTSCGFQGNEPIVCCPTASGTVTTPSTTRRTTTATTTTTTTTTTTPKPVTTTPPATLGTEPKDIARRKCQEYARWVFKTIPSPLNLPNSRDEQESQCEIEGVPLIVGGTPAKPAEFPHMVAIGFGPEAEVSWQCGGTLISENFVLTAAHCTSTRELGVAKWAQVGDLDLSPTVVAGTVGSTGRILEIVQRIRHPSYKTPAKYHDLALMKIAPLASDTSGPLMPPQPIPEGGSHPFFNKYIRPACLHPDFQIPYEKALATGWGRVGHGEDSSPNLLKVQLSIIDSATCNESYRVEATTSKLRNGIDHTVLCAGELEGGKDTCQGDSGGPLQYVLEDIYCMYSMIGVTSFGKLCGFRNSPAVYARISHYLPWIVQNVWPQ